MREEEEEEERAADKSIEADMLLLLLLPISIPTTCCDCDSCASGPSDEAIIKPGAEAEDAAKGEADSSPPKDKAWVKIAAAAALLLEGVVLSMEARVTPAVSLKHLEHMYPVCADP